MISPSNWLAARIPFFYGWVVIGVAFVTMGIGVNSRTAFSLLFPPILDEFGWERGVTAAAFSLGFVASVAVAPFTGLLMDRFGPRFVVSMGAILVSVGLILTTTITTPLGLYLTLGGLVVGSSVFMSYIGHSAFLPRWFSRKRGLAIGIAFSGVGVGSIILFPIVQAYIGNAGWRHACVGLAVLLIVTIVPLNVLLQRTQPEDLGLEPDGDSPDREKDPASTASPNGAPSAFTNGQLDTVVDCAWTKVEWTVPRALGTKRYWWMFFGLMTALYAWYAVQVHQTRYFVEVGFSEAEAAWALGLVGLAGIVGQIGLGHLSDRIGREIGWTFACTGYALCYGLLIALPSHPHPYVMYGIVAAQGLLGYGIAPIYSAIAAELFQGKNFGAIFGTLSVATTLGAASGPWVTGLSYDLTGSYATGFAIALGCSVLSCGFIWLAAPRKVRLVAGRAEARGRATHAARAQATANDLSTSETIHAIAIRFTPINLAPHEQRDLEAVALDRGGRPVQLPSQQRNQNSSHNAVRFEWILDDALRSLGVELVETGAAPIHPQAHGVTLRAGALSGEGQLTIRTRNRNTAFQVSRTVSVISVSG